MVTYNVIFDEAVRGYREWLFPLGLFAAGLWIVFIQWALRRFNRETADRILPLWTRYFALLIGVGGSGFFLLMTYPPHARLRDALRSGKVRTIEGILTSVQPGDPGGFVITSTDGLTHDFHYSDHQLTPGYRDAHPPFRVGQRARVAELDGAVARLEVSGGSSK